jgi:hypothetical protein
MAIKINGLYQVPLSTEVNVRINELIQTNNGNYYNKTSIDGLLDDIESKVSGGILKTPVYFATCTLAIASKATPEDGDYYFIGALDTVTGKVTIEAADAGRQGRLWFAKPDANPGTWHYMIDQTNTITANVNPASLLNDAKTDGTPGLKIVNNKIDIDFPTQSAAVVAGDLIANANRTGATASELLHVIVQDSVQRIDVDKSKLTTLIQSLAGSGGGSGLSDLIWSVGNVSLETDSGSGKKYLKANVTASDLANAGFNVTQEAVAWT